MSIKAFVFWFVLQVKIWFQNRRAKERKQVKKRDEIIAKEKMDAVVQLQHPLMWPVGASGPPPGGPPEAFDFSD